MGNRSNLYLTNTTEQRDFQILEANNQLPFFWVLLLDQSTVTDNDDLFPAEPGEDSPYRSLPLSRETLRSTTDRSRRYLIAFYPHLVSEFNTFADYIIGLSRRGTIEVDLLEITNFTSPREFRDDTLALLQRLDSMEPLSDRERNEYVSDDPTYLIGFDEFVDVSPRYSEVSDSYARAEDGTADSAANSTSTTTTASPATTRRKFPWRKFLSDVILMGFLGVLFIIVSLVVMIFAQRSADWQGVALLLMGIGGIVYAVVAYRNLRRP